MRWLVLVGFLTLATMPQAATYYVAKTGNNSNTCVQAQNVNTAKLTIAAGLACLASGDTLIIKAGTYAEGMLLDTVPSGTLGNHTTIMAATGETVWLKPTTPVTINGKSLAIGNRHYMTVERIRIDLDIVSAGEIERGGIEVSGGSTNILIDGCEVKNARSDNGDMLVVRQYTTDVTIRNCYFHDMLSSPEGSPGTVYIQGSTRTIVENNVLERVLVGISLHENNSTDVVIDPIVRNNIVRDADFGAGFETVSTVRPRVYNNIFHNTNFGVVLRYGEANEGRVYNNTIYNTTNCGIVRKPGIGLAPLEPEQAEWVKNNIFYQVACPSYTPPGNFTSNPLFMNAATADFHLQATSPAINTGITLAEVPTDFDGVTRPRGTAYDYGAYEFVPTATSTVGYGPVNETCTTTGGTVLTTGSAWESTIANAPNGSVFLLRAGTYNFGTDSAGMLIPAGVTVKPYGNGACEDVKITGASTTDDVGDMLRMGANSTLRGVRVEAATTGNRHEYMLQCTAANIQLINNHLWGGTGEAIEINAPCNNFLVQGNDINGGGADNSSQVGNNKTGGLNFSFLGGAHPEPLTVVIRGNKICSNYFPENQKGDDTFAIQSGSNILIEHNYFPSGCTKNKENLVDFKTDSCGTGSEIIWRRNYMERNLYTGTGGGQDNGTFSGLFTIGDHCGDTPAHEHRLEYNVFGNCHAISNLDENGNPAIGGGCGGIGTGNIIDKPEDPFYNTARTNHSLWQYNVFLQDTAQPDNATPEQRLQIGQYTYKQRWIHNTFIRGRWRLQNQNSRQASGPAIFRDNIWYDNWLGDETSAASKYTNSYNTFFSLQGEPMEFDNGNNSTADPEFRDVTGTTPATVDLRLADGSPAIGSASDGKNRGAFQEIPYLSGTIAGNQVRLKFDSGFLPLSKCVQTLFDVEYNTVDATETACTPGPAPNEITLTMSAAPPAGANVTVKWSYGAVEDSMMLGGPEVNWNNKVRAQPVAQVLQGTAEIPTWNQGTQVACSGSNRIVVAAFCWEKLAITTPMTITNVRVGGQLGTKIADIDSPDGTLGVVGNLSALWYFTEANLAAATNSTITYTTSEPQDADRPLLLASGCYPNIADQADPISDSDVSTTTTLPALTTTTPGAAIVTGCSGNAVTWTIGAPWQERIDEITGNTASQFVADATTNGTPLTPTPSTTATRVALVSVAIDGGEEVVEPAVHQHEQTHVAIYRYGEQEGEDRICPVDGLCDLAPTRRFVARAQVEIELAPLASTVLDFWCSDNGGDYYPVLPNSTGWISLSTSMRSGDVLTPQLPLEGDTFRSCGTHYSIESEKAACAAPVGSRIEYEFAGVVSALAERGQLVTCELRKAPNTPLDATPQTIDIMIAAPKANGP